MSQNSFGDSPANPYESPQQLGSAAAPPARPASAAVFGILNIVFGVFGICGIGFTAILFAVPPNPQMPNPALDAMRENEFYGAFSMISLGLGTIATIALIAAGIGLLKMRSWGRTLSIIYASYGIFATIVGAIINYFVLLAPVLEKANEMPAGPQQAGAIGGAIGGTVGSCFGLIYPVVLLCFMLRPSFTAAFKR